ncbi:uncharacterized protein LOC111085694 isoform X2 [Limulus polyphemus]|uniref:Uncharacterized protein LOC111085694 isoform X2 n=1 Tax=Limulus polyphemus TaxID=6850 RepID=A0ABM1SC61_LIMPO|nr:uncharacterized protein LOC111085694 isoform X2 [Limulus polyphemus]
MFYPDLLLPIPPFEARSTKSEGHIKGPLLPPGREKEIPLDLSNKSISQTPVGVVEAEEMFFLEQQKFGAVGAPQGFQAGLHRHLSGVGGSSGTLLDPTLLRLGYRTDAAIDSMLSANMSSPFCVDRTPVPSATPAFGSHHMMNNFFHQPDQHSGIYGSARPPMQQFSSFYEPSSSSLLFRPPKSSLTDRNSNLTQRSLYEQSNPSSLALPSLSLFPDGTQEKGAFVALRSGAEKNVLNGASFEATTYAEHLQRLGEHRVQKNKCLGACCSSSFGNLGQPQSSCSCCSSSQMTLCARGPMGYLGKEHSCDKLCSGGYFNPSLSYLGQHSTIGDIRLSMNPFYVKLGEHVRREESFGSIFAPNPNLWGSELSGAPVSKAVVHASSPVLKLNDSSNLGQKESPRSTKDSLVSSSSTKNRDVVSNNSHFPVSSSKTEILRKAPNEVIVTESESKSKCVKQHSSKMNLQPSDHETENKDNQNEFQRQFATENVPSHSTIHSSKETDFCETRVKMPQLKAVTRFENCSDNSQVHEKKSLDPPPLTAAEAIINSDQANITSSVCKSLWMPHSPKNSTPFSTSSPTFVTPLYYKSSKNSFIKKRERQNMENDELVAKFPDSHLFNQNQTSSLPYRLTNDIQPTFLNAELAKEPGCSRSTPSSHNHTDPSNYNQTQQVYTNYIEQDSDFPPSLKNHQKTGELSKKFILACDPYYFSQEKSEYTFDDPESNFSPLDGGGLKANRKRSMLHYMTSSDERDISKTKTIPLNSFVDQTKLVKEEKEFQATFTKCNYKASSSTSEGVKEKLLKSKSKNVEFEEEFSKEAKRVCVKSKKKLGRQLLSKIYIDQKESNQEDKKEFVKKEADEIFSQSNEVVSQLSLIWRQRCLTSSCQAVKRRRLKSGLDMIAKPHRKKNSKVLSVKKLLEKELLKKQDNSASLEGILDDSLEKKQQLPIDFSNGVPPEMKRIIVNKALGETILHRAARMGYEEIVLYCLETNYCDINARDNAGYTPLHESCSQGNLEIVSALVQYGSDVNASAAGGIRPLHDAVENDHVEIVRMLLSYGADPTIATYSGHTPLKLARSSVMVEFLRGFFADTLGETDTNVVLPWKFCGSACCLDAEEAGYDIWNELPLNSENESEEKDDFLFEDM